MRQKSLISTRLHGVTFQKTAVFIDMPYEAISPCMLEYTLTVIAVHFICVEPKMNTAPPVMHCVMQFMISLKHVITCSEQ